MKMPEKCTFKSKDNKDNVVAPIPGYIACIGWASILLVTMILLTIGYKIAPVIHLFDSIKF